MIQNKLYYVDYKPAVTYFPLLTLEKFKLGKDSKTLTKYQAATLGDILGNRRKLFSHIM